MGIERNIPGRSQQADACTGSAQQRARAYCNVTDACIFARASFNVWSVV